MTQKMPKCVLVISHEKVSGKTTKPRYSSNKETIFYISDTIIFFAGEDLDDSQWHTVLLIRKGKETGIILDGTQKYYLLNDGVGNELTLDSGLYIGGLSEHIINKRKDKLVDKSVLGALR